MASIRRATILDIDDIREVYLRAFSDDEKESVASLAARMLSEESVPETIALIAEIDGKVTGHIAFSPVTADTDESWGGYILAPLGVKPECQGRGIGSLLVENGMRLLKARGVSILFVYGDPRFYGRFGFNAETAAKYLPPYELQYPHGWQALAFQGGCPARHPVTIDCVAPLSDQSLW